MQTIFMTSWKKFLVSIFIVVFTLEVYKNCLKQAL